jgi:HAD superfamily hydrolase (TIGR01549 family)
LKGFKAILLDLDGTLIDVDLKKFIPSYIDLLAKSVVEIIPKRKFVSLLMTASAKIEMNDGSETNEEVFRKTFFPLEGHEREEIEPIFMEFYAKEFNNLKQYTQKKPEAREVVKYLIDKGYDIVIATTPVLPLTAIQQRLDWAGVGDLHYKFITSYENMRASKPNPIYYRQIIDYLGYEPEQCLMVGDEDKDMAARQVGCSTFLIKSQNTNQIQEIYHPDYEGELRDLKKLL